MWDLLSLDVRIVLLFGGLDEEGGERPARMFTYFLGLSFVDGRLAPPSSLEDSSRQAGEPVHLFTAG